MINEVSVYLTNIKYGQHKKFVDWCNKNIGDSLLNEEWDWCRYEFGANPTFYFAKEEDAVAFKLKFGL